MLREYFSWLDNGLVEIPSALLKQKLAISDISDDASIFCKQKTVQPTLLKSPLYCARFNLSIWEAAPWNKMFACKISQISNGNIKQRRACSLGDCTYLGLDFLWCFCIILPMASGEWNSSFLSWEQSLVELKKILIYLKHFCPLFFLLLWEFWRKKVSYCIMLTSMLMKFAFKATAWDFCNRKWFINEHFLFPVDNVLTTSRAPSMQSWLHNLLESLKVSFFFFFFKFHVLWKGSTGHTSMYVNFAETFGDQKRAELCFLLF